MRLANDRYGRFDHPYEPHRCETLLGILRSGSCFETSYSREPFSETRRRESITFSYRKHRNERLFDGRSNERSVCVRQELRSLLLKFKNATAFRIALVLLAMAYIFELRAGKNGFVLCKSHPYQEPLTN